MRKLSGMASFRALKALHEPLTNNLNLRFREGGYGFQIEDGIAIRISDTYQHAEIVVPTLRLLGDSRFRTANEEFLQAHEFFRKGEHEACLTECGKAFETAMKTICAIRGLRCSKNGKDKDPELATSSDLIEAVGPNILMSPSHQSQLGLVRALLNDTVPANRNKDGAHGQGTTGRTVAAHYAAYQIHLTATAITFLVDSLRAVETTENPPR